MVRYGDIALIEELKRRLKDEKVKCIYEAWIASLADEERAELKKRSEPNGERR